MHLECVFIGNLGIELSTLGLAILSSFQEEAVTVVFPIRGWTASNTKETYEEDVDIHGGWLGRSYVAHHEFFASRHRRRLALLECCAHRIADLGIGRFRIWVLHVVLPWSDTEQK
jgi:hypothetical protein